jgi:hypothetical protein
MTDINFATATAEQLAAAGYVVRQLPPKKAPARSLLGTKGSKGARHDLSAWGRI